MVNNGLLHYAPYPFALHANDAGGLPTVFLQEADNARNLVLFTADMENGQVGGAKIFAADQGVVDMSQLRRYWFDVECWATLHPDAYTDVACPSDALQAMFTVESAPAVGSFSYLTSFCLRFSPSPRYNLDFNQRFFRLFQSIENGARMNWQDYFFVPSIIKQAEAMRRKGIFQTFHLHTAVPNELSATAFGRDLLMATLLVDRVYVHTDEYVRRLETQLQALRVERRAQGAVPEIRRFDLGLNRAAIDQALGHFHLERNSMDRTIFDRQLHLLTTRQKELVIDCLRSIGVVPHRFMNIDRLDPIKGTATVVEAVKQFLQRRENAGENNEQLRAKYRFYFLQASLDEPPNELSPRTMYSKFVFGKLMDLVSQYPGVVFVAEALHGEHRSLVLPLILGTHAITGGVQDGLNLAVMENCYVNRQENTALVIGSGAGFGIQARSQGYGSTAFFPAAGKAEAFVGAFEEVIAIQTREDMLLRTMKAPLVNYICSRNDSVIV